MSEPSVDDMINSLTDELEPVKPMAHPMARALPWMIGAAVYAWFVVHHIGLRPDSLEKLSDLHFLFENMLVGLVGISAALCACWLCVPDMRGQKWIIAVPFSFLAVFFLWGGLRSLIEGVHMETAHFGHCMGDGFWIAIVPAAIMVFLSTGGATTRPFLSAFMASLSVASFGYIGLHFTCMMDTVGHAMVYHLIPFVLLGMALGLIARRLYRW